MVVWSAWGLVGVAAIPIGLLLALWVLRSGPLQESNRRLAALLAVEGLIVGTAGGLTYFPEDVAVARAFRVAVAVVVVALPLVYVRFLALLDSPFARWLGHPGVTVAFAVLWVLVAALVLTGTGFEVRPKPSRWGGWETVWAGPGAALAFGSIVLAYLLGLVVAVSSMLRATRGSIARRQAGTYALAFGIRDATFAFVMSIWLIGSVTGTRAVNIDAWDVPLTNVAPILSMVILTYGILRFQMFDIELRLKWTIHRGTVAAIFLAVFFVIAVTAENFLTDRYGWAIGGIAAGLLLFAIAPLQRLGERVADAAMPRVHDTDEYRTVRKREVYQAAYEGMLTDGRYTEKEKDVLATLAADLGLSPIDVRAIEKGSSTTT